jgi:hypothetical protein
VEQSWKHGTGAQSISLREKSGNREQSGAKEATGIEGEIASRKRDECQQSNEKDRDREKHENYEMTLG